MEKEIVIGDKKFIVKEIKYKDLISKTMNTSKEDAAKQLILMSVGITEEEYDNLSMKEGITLQRAVNDINGLNEDFLSQTPLTK